MFDPRRNWWILEGVFVAALASPALFGGCGGDKSSPAATTGGASSTGGSGNATGGQSSGGTAAGGASGGAGGVAPFACNHTAAPGPTIAPGTNGTWGTASDVAGGTFQYQATSEAGSDAVTANTSTTPGSVILTATVNAGEYTGYGLYFKDCIDASQYSGIQFTMSGDLGGGTLVFQVQTNKNYPIDTNNKKGACGGSWSSGCGNNQITASNITGTAAPVQVRWGDMTGGQSNGVNNPVEPNELLGIQWQVNCTNPPDGGTSCPLNITIAEVKFF
jgi:hypothetical protein